MISKARRLHLYLGLFFAPSILFFAFSGAFQTFGLHESHKSAYNPPAWVVKMARVHKDQRLSRSPVGSGITVLKWFVLFMALGLMTTTALGIYMSFAYNRNRIVLWSLLVAGILFPIVLLLI